MTASEILKKARTLIETKRNIFVCDAVHRVGVAQGAKYEVLDHINSLLGGSFTLDQWMAQNHPRLVKVNGACYRKKMRLTRLAWIKHFGALGK